MKGVPTIVGALKGHIGRLENFGVCQVFLSKRYLGSSLKSYVVFGWVSL
jgi:hypothetical protein